MIAGAVMAVDNIAQTFSGLGLFILTVVAGLGCMFISLMIIYTIATRRNPFRFLRYTLKAWFIAFATTSP